MTCHHCQKFSGHNFDEHGKHEKKCEIHLFCEAFCERGRLRLIADIVEVTMKAFAKKRRSS